MSTETHPAVAAADKFRCICNGSRRAVEGCPAHRFRYAFQQMADEIYGTEPTTPAPLVSCCTETGQPIDHGGRCQPHHADPAQCPPGLRAEVRR